MSPIDNLVPTNSQVYVINLISLGGASFETAFSALYYWIIHLMMKTGMIMCSVNWMCGCMSIK